MSTFAKYFNFQCFDPGKYRSSCQTNLSRFNFRIDMKGQSCHWDRELAKQSGFNSLTGTTTYLLSLLYVIREPAVFFRDGQAYRVNWTSLSPPGPIRFMYEDGSAFAYKPGQVFYEIIDSIYEVQQKEDGTWFVRFINP